MSDATITQLRTQITKQITEKTAGLSKLQTAVNNVTKEIANLNSKLSKFDEVFGDGTTTTRRKPGPKPKAVKAAGVKTGTRTTRNKPGPKPKALKAAAKTTTKKVAKKASKANSRATQGRRAVAQGLRPPIRKAMIEICGKKTMNASEMYEALKAKNWLPDSSDPRAYISYLFSSLKDDFVRVEGKGRGFYKIRDDVDTNGTKAETKTATKTNNTTDTASTDVDDVLKEAGVIPAAPAAN